jgi:type II secretory pathway component PulF
LIFFWLIWSFRPITWRSAKASGSWLGVGKWPTQRNIIACSRWSTLLEVLVLLLKRRIPLDESLGLAASVALPAARQAVIEPLLDRCRAGQRLTEQDLVDAGFPRAIATGLATPRRPEATIQVLRQLETEYRWHSSDLRRRFNGPWLTTIAALLAGVFVMAYVVLVILPVVQVYFDVVNNHIN